MANQHREVNMSAGPSLSVVICTWNRAATLAQTLRSLSSMEVPFDWELVVVDNNSTDGTRQVVEAAINLGAAPIRYLFEGRQGKQFALNTGIAATTAPVLAFTDDDVAVPPDWLARARSAMQDRRVDLLGGKTLPVWGASGPPTWYSPQLVAVVAGVDGGPEPLMPAPRDFAPGGTNMIVRRSLFDRIGPFSETHFRHMDQEFGSRAHERGVFVAYEPALVVHAPVDERCLTHRYFTRWAFKAGLSESGGTLAAGRRPAVPGWVYRRCIESFVLSLVEQAHRSQAEVFARRFGAWRDWGTIANAWHAWLRPATHAAWVESRAQKRGGLY